MHKRMIFSVIAFILVMLFIIPCAHSALVGKVSRVEGRADVLKVGTKTITPVKVNGPVDIGDIFRVKSDGRVEITFFDGGAIRIAPGSRLEIKDYSSDADRTNNVIKLSTGHVQVISGTTFVQKVSRYIEGNRFEVHTPNAVAGVRGSNMVVSFVRSVTTTLFIDGKGYQYNPSDPTGTRVTIVKGEISFVHAPMSPPSPPRKATPAESQQIVKTVTVTPPGQSGGTGTGGTGTNPGNSGSSSGTSSSTSGSGDSSSGSTASSGSSSGSSSDGSSTGSAAGTSSSSSGTMGTGTTTGTSTPTNTTSSDPGFTTVMPTTTTAAPPTSESALTAMSTPVTQTTSSTSTTIASNTIAGVTVTTLPTIPVTEVAMTPLVVTIAGVPDVTSSSSATLTVTTSETANLSYSLDGGSSFIPFSGSTVTLTELAEGSHTFLVSATDTYGRTATSSASWTIDLTSPVVSMPGNPGALTNSSSASFTFSATDATAVTYQYSTDGGTTWASTGSTLSLTALPEGTHSLSVRGTDAAGNVSAIQTYTWTTDYTAPSVTATGVPTGPTKDSGATVTLAGMEAGATYEYSTNGGTTWAATSGTITLTGLPEGAQTLTVRGTDPAGNVTTGTASWTTDYTAPVIASFTRTSAPAAGPTGDITITASTGEATDSAFSIDGGPYTAVGGNTFTANVSPGTHTISFTSIDVAGNESTPSTTTFDLERYALTGNVAGAGSTLSGTATGSVAAVINDNWGSWNIAESGSYTGPSSGSWQRVSGGTISDLNSGDNGFWISKVQDGTYAGTAMSGMSDFRCITTKTMGTGTGTVTGSNDASSFSLTESGNSLVSKPLTFFSFMERPYNSTLGILRNATKAISYNYQCNDNNTNWIYGAWYYIDNYSGGTSYWRYNTGTAVANTTTQYLNDGRKITVDNLTSPFTYTYGSWDTSQSLATLIQTTAPDPQYTSSTIGEDFAAHAAGDMNAFIGGSTSIFTATQVLPAQATVIGRYVPPSSAANLWFSTDTLSRNFITGKNTTYDTTPGAYFGFLGGIDTASVLDARLIGLYTNSAGDIGYLRGSFSGNAYPESGMFSMDGGIYPETVEPNSGLTAENFWKSITKAMGGGVALAGTFNGGGKLGNYGISTRDGTTNSVFMYSGSMTTASLVKPGASSSEAWGIFRMTHGFLFDDPTSTWNARIGGNGAFGLYRAGGNAYSGVYTYTDSGTYTYGYNDYTHVATAEYRRPSLGTGYTTYYQSVFDPGANSYTYTTYTTTYTYIDTNGDGTPDTWTPGTTTSASYDPALSLSFVNTAPDSAYVRDYEQSNVVGSVNDGYWLGTIANGTWNNNKLTASITGNFLSRTMFGTISGDMIGAYNLTDGTVRAISLGTWQQGTPLTSVSNVQGSSFHLTDVGFTTYPSTLNTGNAPCSAALYDRFLYVANNASSTISVYTVNNVGSITAGTPVSTESGPTSLYSTGALLFVTNSTAQKISMYGIEPAAGGLTLAGTVSTGAGTFPNAVAAASNYLYVTDTALNTISVYSYSIAPMGSMSLVSTTTTGGNPSAVKAHFNGNWVYVTSLSANTISTYTVDVMTGTLTAGATLPTGNSPKSISIDPLGKFLYVANYGSNTVSVYVIDQATGQLTMGAPVTTQNGPSSVSVDSDGKYVYVSCDSSVIAYSINQSTGALSKETMVTNKGGDFIITSFTPYYKAVVGDTDTNTVSVYNIGKNVISQDGVYQALLGATESLWSSTQATPAHLQIMGISSSYEPNYYEPKKNNVYMAPITSTNYTDLDPVTTLPKNTTYDGGAYAGYLGGINTGNNMAAKMAALYIDPSGNAGYLKGSFTGTSYPDISMFEMTGSAYPTQMASGIGIGPEDLAGNIAKSHTSAGSNNYLMEGSFAGSGTVTGIFSTALASITNYTAATAQKWGIFSQQLSGEFSNPSGATAWSAVANVKGMYGLYGLTNTNHESYSYNTSNTDTLYLTGTAGGYTYNYVSSGLNAGLKGFITYRYPLMNTGYNVHLTKTNAANPTYTAAYQYYAYDPVGKYWYHTYDQTYTRTGNITASSSLDPAERPPANWTASEMNIGSSDVGYGITSYSGSASGDALSAGVTGKFISLTKIGTYSGEFLGAVDDPGATEGNWRGVAVGSWTSDPLAHVFSVRTPLWHANATADGSVDNGYLALQMGSKDSIFGGTSSVTLLGDYEAVDRTVNRVFDSSITTTYNSGYNGPITYDGGAYKGYLVGVSVMGAPDTVKTLFSGLYRDPSARIGYITGGLAGQGYPGIFALDLTGTLTSTPVTTTAIPLWNFHSSVVESYDSPQTDDHFIGGSFTGNTGSMDGRFDMSTASVLDPTNNISQNWGIFKMGMVGNFSNTASSSGWSAVMGGRNTFGFYGLTNMMGNAFYYPHNGVYKYGYYTDTLANRSMLGYSMYRQYDSATPLASTGFDAGYRTDGTIIYKNYAYDGTGWYYTGSFVPAGFPATWNSASPETIMYQLDAVKPAGYTSYTSGKGKSDTGFFLLDVAGAVSSDLMESTSMNGTFMSQTQLGALSGSLLGASVTPGATSGVWSGVAAGVWSGTPLQAFSQINATRYDLQTTGELTGESTEDAGAGPRSVTFDPTGRFAYVPNQGDNTVSVYTIEQSTGTLTAVGTPVGTGTAPTRVAVDPTGRFAYVTNLSSNTISVYTIDQVTGTLTALGSPVAAGGGPRNIVVDPTGRFAYVTNNGSNTVSMYTIDQSTGALTALGSPVAAGTTPWSVSVDPKGRFAYVTNYGSGNVSVFTINESTGMLTALGSPVAAGSQPYGMVIDPTGRFVYVANGGSNTVSMYTIDQSTGTLTALGTPVGTGTMPVAVTVDPTGKFAYVTNNSSNTVYVYMIDQSTGSLIMTGNAPTGTTPGGVSVDPTGKFAYVANQSSNTISVFSIDAQTRTSNGSLLAFVGSATSLFNGGTTPVTMMGTYGGATPASFIWGQQINSFNYLTGQSTTYDTPANAYTGYLAGYKADDNTTKARWAAIYAKADGSAGIHLGSLTGNVYPDISMLRLDGSLNAPVEMVPSTPGIGFTPDTLMANVNSRSFANGTPLLNSGVFDGGGMLSTSYFARERIAINGQPWGVWKSQASGTYAGTTSDAWSLSLVHIYPSLKDVRGTEMTGTLWSGNKLEGTSIGYSSDWASGNAWVAIGDVIGTFDPTALTFEMTSAGSYMHVDRFLAMTVTEATKLQALNIPCVEVGSVNLAGSTNYGTGTVNVTMNNTKFFATSSGAPAQLWATGTSQMGSWTGTAPPSNASVAISGGGLNANFNFKAFDPVSTNKWGATITNGTGGFNGSTTFRGAAAGTINTGAGTFSGSAAGVAK